MMRPEKKLEKVSDTFNNYYSFNYSFNDMQKKSLIIAVSICLMFSASSCYILIPNTTYPVPKHSSGMVKFSPDNTKIAFVWSEYWTDMSMNQNIVKEEKYLFWCDVDNINRKRSIKIDSLENTGYGGPTPQKFLFSPDSQNILFISQNRLSCVNLETKKLTYFSETNENIHIYGWVNNNEIEFGRKLTNTFWHVNIAEPTKRAKILSLPDKFGESLDDSRRWGLGNYPPYWLSSSKTENLKIKFKTHFGTDNMSLFKMPFPNWIGAQVWMGGGRKTTIYYWAVKTDEKGNVLKVLPLFPRPKTSGLWDFSSDGKLAVTFKSSKNLKLHNIDISKYGL